MLEKYHVWPAGGCQRIWTYPSAGPQLTWNVLGMATPPTPAALQDEIGDADKAPGRSLDQLPSAVWEPLGSWVSTGARTSTCESSGSAAPQIIWIG